MKTLAIIPARYASTRFPGKPLALLDGRSIISHVYGHVHETPQITDSVVATDDIAIFDHVKNLFGEAAVMMTASSHRSGTDRCGEVLQAMEQRGKHYDIVINVQGDEPFVDPTQLTTLIDCFDKPDVQIATLKTRIHTLEELSSPNNVKVVCGDHDQALYFSRQPLPYLRGIAQEHWLEKFEYYKHVGIYAFRPSVLHEICQLAPAAIEQAESLEQLRWLSAGYSIRVKETQHANIGIDTPDDLAAAERYIKTNKKQ